eukprot:2866531-Pyramimonas_sp.AAC.1
MLQVSMGHWGTVMMIMVEAHVDRVPLGCGNCWDAGIWDAEKKGGKLSPRQTCPSVFRLEFAVSDKGSGSNPASSLQEGELHHLRLFGVSIFATSRSCVMATCRISGLSLGHKALGRLSALARKTPIVRSVTQSCDRNVGSVRRVLLSRSSLLDRSSSVHNDFSTSKRAAMVGSWHRARMVTCSAEVRKRESTATSETSGATPNKVALELVDFLNKSWTHFHAVGELEIASSPSKTGILDVGCNNERYPQ